MLLPGYPARTKMLRIWLTVCVALMFTHEFRAAAETRAILTLVRQPSHQELQHNFTGAKFEPLAGCYLGAYIDFDSSLPTAYIDSNKTEHRDPAAFERLVGRQHAMYFFYMGYGKPLPGDWVRRLAAAGKIVHIALEPNNGLKWVKEDKYLVRLAQEMGRTRAPIFLRFASEMNGRWTAYHGNPAEYRAKFKLVHTVMRKYAPNVAMVWCPYFSPENNISDYYPGDTFVDWVGVNMYSVTFHNNSLNSPCEQEHPCDMLDTVYKQYATRKPIMICEYGATHRAQCQPERRADFAINKISTLYAALSAVYPRVKCINYFDSNTLQFAADLAFNDYCVTNDPAVRIAYSKAVSSAYYLHALQRDLHSASTIPRAVPIKDGDVLRGIAEISCYARAGNGSCKVQYLVDGYQVYAANSADMWTFLWPARDADPGKHMLTLLVRNSRGVIVARQSVTVIVQK